MVFNREGDQCIHCTSQSRELLPDSYAGEYVDDDYGSDDEAEDKLVEEEDIESYFNLGCTEAIWECRTDKETVVLNMEYDWNTYYFSHGELNVECPQGPSGGFLPSWKLDADTVKFPELMNLVGEIEVRVWTKAGWSLYKSESIDNLTDVSSVEIIYAALKLGIEIKYSDTIREVYSKLIPVIKAL